jgi:outer membrane protein assembly factor BamA
MSFSKNTLKIRLDDRTDSAFIQRLFANNLITATGLNFLYSDKNTTQSKTTFFIRTNVIELGGNIHRGVRRLMDNVHNSDTSYKLLNVDYYNYAKSEIDARCSTIIDENNSTAIRINIGAAYPYGNQKVTPFDKLFFIGGANSLRAWRPRTIGPGAYYESSKNFRIDRAGDLILQANAEYRFDIVNKKLEGAVFFDAGNVWMIRDVNNIDQLKLFKYKTFISEIAANTGIGMRFDFQFFLFRLDWGMQIHNPEKPIGQTWVIKEFAQNKYFTKYSILNFGIGYPF